MVAACSAMIPNRASRLIGVRCSSVPIFFVNRNYTWDSPTVLATLDAFSSSYLSIYYVTRDFDSIVGRW